MSLFWARVPHPAIGGWGRKRYNMSWADNGRQKRSPLPTEGQQGTFVWVDSSALLPSTYTCTGKVCALEDPTMGNIPQLWKLPNHFN